MILSDIYLKKLREQKCFPDNCYIGPSSVDLSLSPSYAKLTSVVGIINPEKKLNYDDFTSDISSIVLLHPLCSAFYIMKSGQ